MASDSGLPGSGRLWHVIELWDYGCEVEITAPTDFTEHAPLRNAVRELWRKRRQYKQRTETSQPTPKS